MNKFRGFVINLYEHLIGLSRMLINDESLISTNYLVRNWRNSIFARNSALTRAQQHYVGGGGIWRLMEKMRYRGNQKTVEV